MSFCRRLKGSIICASKAFLCLAVCSSLLAAPELGFPIYSWAKESAPKAVVVAIHGATLHGRSYTRLAQVLSERGYSIFAPDMRGYGAWYHDSSESDKLAKNVIYSQSEADLHKLLNKLHELYPGKPIFLMGESVGANMAVRLLADFPSCADGMILSSTAIKQRLFFGPTSFLQMLTVFFVKPKAQLDITPYLRSRVSESPEITEERVKDPLGRTKLNVVELFKTRFFNKDCLKLLPLLSNTSSVLVLEGSEDRLFHSDDVTNLMAQLPCQDKTLHVLQGRGHINLETTYVCDEVQDVVEKWLSERCTKLRRDTATVSTTVSSQESRKVP